MFGRKIRVTSSTQFISRIKADLLRGAEGDEVSGVVSKKLVLSSRIQQCSGSF